MRRLRLVIVSTILAVGSSFAIAAPVQAGPPEHCETAGELPDPCPVAYRVCQTKPGQYICRD